LVLTLSARDIAVAALVLIRRDPIGLRVDGLPGD
jgi:hypothetical protein